MQICVLIIDDDDDDRHLFCSAVKTIDSSIECIQANNGEEALAILRSPTNSNPDFIFLDLNMPRVNGKQFLLELKADNEIEHIPPVIVYTSSKWDKDKVETKMLGAVHFITKPDTLTDLLTEILFVFDRKWEHVEH